MVPLVFFFLSFRLLYPPTGMIITALLFLYLAVYVKYIKRNKSGNDDDEVMRLRSWEESHPHVIHIGAVAAMVSMVSFIVAWWPVFHLLSIVIVVSENVRVEERVLIGDSSAQPFLAVRWSFFYFAELEHLFIVPARVCFVFSKIEITTHSRYGSTRFCNCRLAWAGNSVDGNDKRLSIPSSNWTAGDL